MDVSSAQRVKFMAMVQKKLSTETDGDVTLEELFGDNNVPQNVLDMFTDISFFGSDKLGAGVIRTHPINKMV